MSLKEQFEKQITQEVKSFRTGVDKIRNSKNPYYHDPKVADYEINQLKEAMEKKVRELESEFQDKIDEQIAQASKEAARSTFFVGSSDKQFVSAITSDLVTKLTFAGNDSDKAKALSEYENKLEAIENEGAFSEVIKQLAEASRTLSNDEYAQKKLRGLYNTLNSGLQTSEQAQLELLQDDKLSGVSKAFRNLRLIHPEYKSYQASRRTVRDV